MTSAPDVDVTTKPLVAWNDSKQESITITIPDPASGYSGVPYPNLHQSGPYAWQSCAPDPKATYPIPYSVTFTTVGNKKIYGHIIIQKQ